MRIGAWFVALAAAGAPAIAQVTEYEDEAAFLSALSAAGYDALVEGFEGAAWDDYRTTNPFDPQAAPSVVSQGLTWSGNDWITTNLNWGRDGTWGVFTASITQGWPESFLIEADRTLYAAGGWFNGNPDTGADIGIVIDGVTVADRQIGSGHQFIGVIYPDGFTSVEFVDLEGQAAIGADDFTFGALAPACPADLTGDGAVDGADLALLLGAWGPCPGCAADLDADGVITGADLALLLGAWGACAP